MNTGKFTPRFDAKGREKRPKKGCTSFREKPEQGKKLTWNTGFRRAGNHDQISFEKEKKKNVVP